MVGKNQTKAARASANASSENWNGGEDDGPTMAQARPEGERAPDDAEAEADPVNREEHLDEAARRDEMANVQTTHERDAGLDGISGTQNPGVVKDATGHSSQGEAGNSDMSGKKALPDPLLALDPKHLKAIHDALTQAERVDVASHKRNPEHNAEQARNAKIAAERSAGWRSLADLGVHKATLDALVDAGKVETGAPPGMHYHTDTGRVYRIKRDRG